MSSSARYDRIMKRRFITSDDIRAAASRRESALALPENSTVTEEARELALKLSIRLGDGGSGNLAAPAPAARAAQAAVPANPGPIASVLDGVRPKPAAPGSGPTRNTGSLSDDAGARISDAIVAVLKEMNLEQRAAAILPVVTRRVYAGLSAGRN